MIPIPFRHNPYDRPDADPAVDPHAADLGTLTPRVKMRSDVFVYLAGPITAKDGYTVEANVAAALAVFLTCIARGIPAFCPHVTAAFPSSQEVDYETWLAYDLRVLDRCTHLLLLPRWETSPGAVGERRYAEQIGVPVIVTIDDL